MKVAISGDHAGYQYKNLIAAQLKKLGHEVIDYGTCDAAAVDYPDYGYAVGESVASGVAERGIVVCGSAIGISIAANKVPGVRCAVCYEPYITELSRRHNDANVMALSERLMGIEMVERLVEIFMSTPFEGGRHAYRAAKLSEYTGAVRDKAKADVKRGEVSGAETPKNLLGSRT